MVKGMLGRKAGMTRIFTEDGAVVPVTYIEAGPCSVVQRKTRDIDGYEAVQLGFAAKRKDKAKKPESGHFAKAGVEPCRELREFSVDAASELKPGDAIKADMFAAGERVDVVGVSKGRGFAGVHKRHGFGGGPETHGSNFHRAPGSIGQSADPAKTFKNKKMPGHMGNARVTVQNIEVVQVDGEKNLIAVRGAVPGPNGGVVVIRKSVKGSA